MEESLGRERFTDSQRQILITWNRTIPLAGG